MDNNMFVTGKNLRYLFLRFLKIGATSWGGYMALTAMIEKQMCEIDKAIEEEKVVHAISLASVLPGPVAVNVVAYIGYQLKGIKGAFISMFAVLLPCFILMIILSYLYFSYGNIPAFNNFFEESELRYIRIGNHQWAAEIILNQIIGQFFNRACAETDNSRKIKLRNTHVLKVVEY